MSRLIHAERTLRCPLCWGAKEIRTLFAGRVLPCPACWTEPTAAADRKAKDQREP